MRADIWHRPVPLTSAGIGVVRAQAVKPGVQPLVLMGERQERGRACADWNACKGGGTVEGHKPMSL